MSVEVCTIGHYLNITTDRCTPCPRGSYQEKEGRETSCTSCPPDTTTDDIGSTNEGQCSNPCLVDGKVELCPANSYCVFHKESQSYACECKPKYRKVHLHPDSAHNNRLDTSSDDAEDETGHSSVKGHTMECRYVCEDHCLNGGRCEVSLETNRARCECPSTFYGDKCEIKSGFVMIASGIGASVVFIIFMVLLIWMICVRTSSSRGSINSLKKMNIPTLPDPFRVNPQAANFYYGAPAPYAESIAPSQHSTYAHYYDDEEGWELPNFFNETHLKESLANGLNKASMIGTLRGIPNPSIYGTKDDLYDRLRRHQYTGGSTNGTRKEGRGCILIY